MKSLFVFSFFSIVLSSSVFAKGFHGQYAALDLGTSRMRAKSTTIGIDTNGDITGGGTANRNHAGLLSIAYGYNHVFENNYFLGAEGNLHLRGHSVIRNADPELEGDIKLRNIFDVRGKFGYNFCDKILAYGLAGAETIQFSNGLDANSYRAMKTGFLYGIGLETSINDNFAVRAEYYITHFGKINSTVRQNSDISIGQDKVSFSTARIGVIYRF